MRKDKYYSLDGLRGLAALAVVFYHYITFFVPFIIGYGATQQSMASRVIGITPLNLFAGGNFAVCLFFVLSGFVLSLSFFKHRSVWVLVSSASRRYLRLMLPALGSVLLSYALLRTGLMYVHRAQPIVGTNVLGASWNFPPHLLEALHQAVYTMFATDIHYLGSAYNPVLWTMHYELLGSFLVFLFLALFGKLRARAVFYVIGTVLYAKTYYLAFLAGMAMADLFLNFPAIKDAVGKKWTLVALGAGLVLAGWPTDQTVYPGPFAEVDLPHFSVIDTYVLAHIAGAILVMFAVLKLRPLAKFFEQHPMQYLGKISFSLYLVHFLILGSLGAYLFSHLMPHFGNWAALAGTMLPCLSLTFGLAALYARWVDAPSVAASKQVSAYAFRVIAQAPAQWRQLKQKLRARQRPDRPEQRGTTLLSLED